MSIGILFIHGTFGSPQEFESLAAVLQQQGYTTAAVTLPGHINPFSIPARQPTPLNKLTPNELLTHCHSEYYRLAVTCDQVVVIGHSLGGVMALLLAANSLYKLAGVVALSTPCNRAYFVNDLMRLIGWAVMHPLQLPKACWLARHSNTPYPTPVFKPWWFGQLKRDAYTLFADLGNALPRIRVPVMLGHSPLDMVVPYGEQAKLAKALTRSRKITYVTLTQCGHQIFPHSAEAQPCTANVLKFIQTVGTKLDKPD